MPAGKAFTVKEAVDYALQFNNSVKNGKLGVSQAKWRNLEIYTTGLPKIAANFDYSYYFNNRSSEPWAGTLVTKYKNIKHNSLNHLRTKSKTKYTYLANGGWHFTNQGGPDQIRKKLESYGHQEFNNRAIKTDLENKITKNRYIFAHA